MKINWKHLVLTMAFFCAFQFALAGDAIGVARSLKTAEPLRYDISVAGVVTRPESLFILNSGSGRRLPLSFAQDVPPGDTFALLEYTFTTGGGSYQINRVERRFWDYGNGFFAGVSTGGGWRVEDGVPVVMPLSLSWGGEFDLDAFVLVFRGGGDLIAPQGEKFVGRLTYGIALRVPAPSL